MSCEKCNIKKGTKDIKDFLKKDPERLKKIETQVKKPLADTAAVNATRFRLLEVLKSTDLSVETGSGSLTKFNRIKLELPKTHYFDAVCVGLSTPDKLIVKGLTVLIIKATGHGSRQMSITDKFGFPKSHKTRTKFHFGFRTGDIVRADVPKGKNTGTHVGRVSTRKTGQFDLNTGTKTLQIINHKYCTVLQQHDGYIFVVQCCPLNPPLEVLRSPLAAPERSPQDLLTLLLPPTSKMVESFCMLGVPVNRLRLHP